MRGDLDAIAHLLGVDLDVALACWPTTMTSCLSQAFTWMRPLGFCTVTTGLSSTVKCFSMRRVWAPAERSQQQRGERGAGRWEAGYRNRCGRSLVLQGAAVHGRR